MKRGAPECGTSGLCMGGVVTDDNLSNHEGRLWRSVGWRLGADHSVWAVDRGVQWGRSTPGEEGSRRRGQSRRGTCWKWCAVIAFTSLTAGGAHLLYSLSTLFNVPFKIGQKLIPLFDDKLCGTQEVHVTPKETHFASLNIPSCCRNSCISAANSFRTDSTEVELPTAREKEGRFL